MEPPFNKNLFRYHIDRFVQDDEHGPFLFTVLSCLVENCNFLVEKLDMSEVKMIRSVFNLECTSFSLRNRSVSRFCLEMKEKCLEVGLLNFSY